MFGSTNDELDKACTFDIDFKNFMELLSVVVPFLVSVALGPWTADRVSRNGSVYTCLLAPLWLI